MKRRKMTAILLTAALAGTLALGCSSKEETNKATDEKTEAEAGRGLMAPRVALCAAHQANLVVRLILGEE